MRQIGQPPREPIDQRHEKKLAKARSPLGWRNKTIPCDLSPYELVQLAGSLKLCEAIPDPNPREPCGRRQNFT